MKKVIVAIGVVLSLSSALFLPPFPQTGISNGIIQASLYLPDSINGYYQGVRFDWSGVFASLDYKGHTYFGPWFENYDPKLHDAISGPVEDFTPIGYNEAQPGEVFMKIGIGALLKKDNSIYRFARPYQPVDLGKWTVKKGPDKVEFLHELTNAAGYSYQYRKTVRLLKGKPVLVLEHSLKNTGQKIIETSVYNHNFFVMDNQPTGPDFSVTFPFNLQLKEPGRGMGTTAEVKGKRFGYLKELAKGESTHCYLTGFGTSASDYDIRIENSKTGAGVRITGDQPLSDLVFWSVRTVLSPEPYIKVKAEPGKEFKWKISYEYYTLPRPASRQ